MKLANNPLWKYHKCKKCGLYAFRKNVVIGEGDFPSDILFIGEAPGKSEDLLSRPFIGPSGRIFREGIKRASERTGIVPSYYITNTVGCRPTDEYHGKNREPMKEEIVSCFPRLRETERLVNPKRIVLLGQVAQYYCGSHFPNSLKLLHPSYLLRQGGIECSEFRNFVRELSDLFLEVGGKVVSKPKRMIRRTRKKKRKKS